MARKSSPVLPGLSRSVACSSACGRLRGHKGEHRPTLAAPALAIVRIKCTVACLAAYEAGTHVAHGPAKAPAKARKASPKVAKVLQCRISRNGIRCSRDFGHKQAGKRHAFGGVTVVAPIAEPSRVQAVTSKHARRRGFVVSSKPSSRLA